MALKRGDKGKEVREMASALCVAGYLSGFAVNDDFDWEKQASVKVFQEDEGLNETGIFDDETKRALNRKLAAKG